MPLPFALGKKSGLSSMDFLTQALASVNKMVTASLEKRLGKAKPSRSRFHSQVAHS